MLYSPNRFAIFIAIATIMIAGPSSASSTALAARARTVEAILQVGFPTSDVLPSDKDHTHSDEFRVRINTYAALLKSQFVLKSALVKREIAILKVVQDHDPDPVAWIQKALWVEIPKNSELIIVRLTATGDTDQLRQVLNQIINSFTREVVFDRRIQEEERHEKIRAFYKQISNEYRSNMEKYFVLSKELEAAKDRSVELNMLELELEIQRDFLKDLARSIKFATVNDFAMVSIFRVAQDAMVVENPAKP